MNAAIKSASGFLMQHPSAPIIGVFVALLLSFIWPVVSEEWDQAIDRMYPPAKGRATNVVVRPGEVEFDLHATRLRADCKMVDRRGYQRSTPSGLLRDAPVKRLTNEALIQLPVGQESDRGRWIATVDQSATVFEFWVLYICDSRQVQTPIFWLPLLSAPVSERPD